MKIKYEYSDRVIYFTPYSTKIEKDILIYTTISKYTLDGIIEILKDNFECNFELSREEKFLVIFMLRTLSVGEELQIKYTCDCKTVSDTSITLENFTKNSKILNSSILDQYKKLTHDNINDFYYINTDELDIDEYDDIYSEISESITKFDFNKLVKCISCNKKTYIKLDTHEYMANCLSEDSLMSLYQSIADLVFFGKYNTTDIYNMLPFERSIFIGILNKTREELNS